MSSLVQTKVLVAMSGGVDSSVAAAILQKQGYQVTGVTMKIWSGEACSEKSLHHGCYGPEEEDDIQDACLVAEKLDIPFRVLDLTSEYKNTVLDYFSQEYACGRTPNPCVRCNHRIKFGALIQKAREAGLDFDFIASGHYARVQKNDDRYLLKRACDLTKDQSYFLAFLSQEQLSRLIFPLGELSKVEVRRIASDLELNVAEKPDSQNFISGDYSAVIKASAVPGAIIDKSGKILGQHKGIQFYTIGQRKGIGIASKDILYVTDIDAEKNSVIVGRKEDIYSDECTVSSLNWIAIRELNQPLEAKVKIRSSHKASEATLIPIDNGKIKIKFREPQMAITPGQAAVFYEDDTVIGGGIID